VCCANLLWVGPGNPLYILYAQNRPQILSSLCFILNVLAQDTIDYCRDDKSIKFVSSSNGKCKIDHVILQVWGDNSHN